MLNSLTTISAILFIVLVNYFLISTQDVYVLLAAFITVYIVGYLLFASSIKRLVKRLKFFISIFLFLFIFHSIFNQSINISFYLLSALKTVLQIATISEMMLILTGKISLSKFINGLFFLPDILKMIITITFSFIPFLVNEHQKIVLVQKSRGMGCSSISKVTSVFSTIIPLIHRLFRRSEDLALVIDMRGGSRNTDYA